MGGNLLSRPCKPLWTPIARERAEVCVNCGLLVSKHTPCLRCNLCATGSGSNDSLPDTSLDKRPSEKASIDRDYLTNYIVCALRHIGAADLTTAIEHLLSTAVDLSVQPRW